MIFPDHRRRSGRQADAGKMDPGEETQRGHFVLTQPAALFRRRNFEIFAQRNLETKFFRRHADDEQILAFEEEAQA